MNQWQIGDVKVTRVVEMEVTGGSRFILPDATRDACLPMEWLKPHFIDDAGNLVMSIHALVIDTGDRRVVVDTCIGNDKQRSIPNWTNLQTSFLADLTGAGYPRESIDTVLCTHLHVDHVGWNTMLVDGEWVPTFPNARYLVADKEFQYWDSAEADQLNEGIMGDSVRPIADAGLMDLVDWEHKLCEEIWLEPTPGHTPGHVSVHIRSAGAEALITGDCIHHPCQMTRTDWCSSADYDMDEGRQTRERLLATYVDSDILVIGTHFATPTAGYIRRLEDGGYWLDVGSSR
ncbi:MAG: MBL fold metallo-hydrolase [Pseudomonadales bacterium]|jgi:glyoxylase-like metal-dependent hydrolase (beta-lactamase superfamily II)